MAGFKVNLAGVPTNNIVDEGTYRVALVKGTVRKARSSDNMTANCEFSISDDAYPELNGRKLWNTYTLSPELLWIFKKDLITLGADPEDLEDEFDVEELLKEYAGSTAMAAVTVQEDTREGGTGRPQNRMRLLMDE